MHERTPQIILDESLFHVVKSALNECGGGIIILERGLEIHPLLENTQQNKVKALKDICGMKWNIDNLDSMSGKFF
jgi:hypothetical protein